MKLIFIYNANSGPLQTAFDIGHKLLSPSTYACDLCQLTHGAFKERTAWKTFRENHQAKMIFLHKDEAILQYPNTEHLPLPTVLKEEGASLMPLLGPEKLKDLKTTQDLIQSLQKLTSP